MKYLNSLLNANRSSDFFESKLSVKGGSAAGEPLHELTLCERRRGEDEPSHRIGGRGRRR